MARAARIGSQMEQTSRPHRYHSRKRTELSDRQRHILDLIVKRYTNQQIADEEGMTLDGAKWHITQIMTKLGVDTREEAAEFWRVHNGGRARLSRALLLAFAEPVRWVAIGTATVGVVAAVAIGLYVSWPGGDEALPAASPAATASTGMARVDTGKDLVFVLDELEFDGTSTAVTYHLEGDLSGIRLLPGEPSDPELVPPIEVRGGAASGTVIVAGRPDALRFPSAARRVEQELRIELPVDATTPLDVATPHGTFTVEWDREDQQQVRVRLVGHEALALTGVDTSNGAAIVDDLGNIYSFAHGDVEMPASWDDPRPATALLTFGGEMADGARTATLVLQTYDALIYGDWHVSATGP